MNAVKCASPGCRNLVQVDGAQCQYCRQVVSIFGDTDEREVPYDHEFGAIAPVDHEFGLIFANSGLYCEGCALECPEEDLVNGLCGLCRHVEPVILNEIHEERVERAAQADRLLSALVTAILVFVGMSVGLVTGLLYVHFYLKGN